MIDKKTIEKLEAIQDYQARIYYGIELTDEQKVAQKKALEQSEQLIQILVTCVEDDPNREMEYLYDRLRKSIFEGGTVRFYRPHDNFMIGEAKTMDDFVRLRSENSIETLLVFVRPDGTAISKNEPLNQVFP